MRPSILRRFLLAVLETAICISATAQEFALREGDRVVFCGDSITDQRLYTTFTETFVLTRFPELTLRHNSVHFTRWRQIQVPLAGNKSSRVQAGVAELMSALDEEEAGLVREQRSAAQPKVRQYRLAPK